MPIEKQYWEGYHEFFKELKDRIGKLQIKAAIAVNKELITLYWQIGKDILHRQQTMGWGAQVIDRLSRDLKSAFPGQDGFSP